MVAPINAAVLPVITIAGRARSSKAVGQRPASPQRNARPISAFVQRAAGWPRSPERVTLPQAVRRHPFKTMPADSRSMSATSDHKPRNTRDTYRFPNDPHPAVPGKRNITPKSFRDAQAADGRIAMAEYRQREAQVREQMARLRALRLANRQKPLR
jgi:hypothetical protein